MQAFERFGTDVKVKLEPENSNQENSFKIYLIEGSKRLQKGAKEAAERGQKGHRKGPRKPQKIPGKESRGCGRLPEPKEGSKGP